MAWSSDTSIPIDHLKVADVPSAIRDVKLGLESGAITMASKVMVAPVISDVLIPVTSVLPAVAASTGYVSIIASTSIFGTPTTSGAAIVCAATTVPIIKNQALFAHTGFSVIRTADMNSNIILRNNYSTAAAGQILVAGTYSNAVVSVLLNSADAADLGSLELGAAAVTDSGRGAAVLLYGTDHATYPAQIRLRRGSATTGFISACTSLISNVLDPISAQDAATKGYVDLINALGLAKIKIGSYTGDGTTTRTITGVGFQPDYLIVYNTTGGSSASIAFRSSQDTVNYGKWSTGGYSTDNINSFNADGFVIAVGGSTYINNSERKYVYIAIKATT